MFRRNAGMPECRMFLRPVASWLSRFRCCRSSGRHGLQQSRGRSVKRWLHRAIGHGPGRRSAASVGGGPQLVHLLLGEALRHQAAVVCLNEVPRRPVPPRRWGGGGLALGDFCPGVKSGFVLRPPGGSLAAMGPPLPSRGPLSQTVGSISPTFMCGILF